jgi:hypothetical protein
MNVPPSPPRRVGLVLAGLASLLVLLSVILWTRQDPYGKGTRALLQEEQQANSLSMPAGDADACTSAKRFHLVGDVSFVDGKKGEEMPTAIECPTYFPLINNSPSSWFRATWPNGESTITQAVLAHVHWQISETPALGARALEAAGLHNLGCPEIQYEENLWQLYFDAEDEQGRRSIHRAESGDGLIWEIKETLIRPSEVWTTISHPELLKDGRAAGRMYVRCEDAETATVCVAEKTEEGWVLLDEPALKPPLRDKTLMGGFEVVEGEDHTTLWFASIAKDGSASVQSIRSENPHFFPSKRSRPLRLLKGQDSLPKHMESPAIAPFETGVQMFIQKAPGRLGGGLTELSGFCGSTQGPRGRTSRTRGKGKSFKGSRERSPPKSKQPPAAD